MTARTRLRLSACLIATAALAPRSPAADAFDPVRDLIRRKLHERAAPSVVVAVARDGRLIWEEAFGWADLEQKRAASVHTPYRLGSVSKPITATAIVRACERGLLDLDRPLNDYLGDAKLRAMIGDEI